MNLFFLLFYILIIPNFTFIYFVHLEIPITTVSDRSREYV